MGGDDGDARLCRQALVGWNGISDKCCSKLGGVVLTDLLKDGCIEDFCFLRIETTFSYSNWGFAVENIIVDISGEGWLDP